jgi:pyruvate, water dikinase
MAPKKHNLKENILWFKDITKADISLVGGKGANLGEVARHFPVPNGFCVTVNAYRQFLEQTMVGAHIHSLLDSIDSEKTEELDRASEKIRALIMQQKFPAGLKAEIEKNYKKLKNKKVAVRSSATAEDLPKASFAGQQDTYLNMKGEKAVIDAVQRCWASLFTSRAIYYREKNNFKHREVLISVVVQEMVDPKFAGVMFTVDPVKKKHILIEIVEGLGEKLVSGQVTPNTYFMNKKAHTLEQAHEQFKFDRNLLPNISKTGEKIEKHYGFPQDIEFAIDKRGKLLILQSRPITTL